MTIEFYAVKMFGKQVYVCENSLVGRKRDAQRFTNIKEAERLAKKLNTDRSRNESYQVVPVYASDKTCMCCGW